MLNTFVSAVRKSAGSLGTSDSKTISSPVAARLAFSKPVREAVRKIGSLDKPRLVEKVLSHSRFAGAFRAIESETLPVGNYYIRLRIPDWKDILGDSFQLMYRGDVVYGNVIEPPEKDYPLEYRNIVASSSNESDYSVTLASGERRGENIAFSIEFSDGVFSTKEQILYDERFGIHKHGDTYYALRGNTKNPSKVIFSFPGLGMSAGRIVYPVSAMKDLTDRDLADALLVILQDRYLVPGSYMLLDSMGRPITSEISQLLRSILQKYNLTDADALLFGASKGATSAIYYAMEFPQAVLLLSTPQLNLPSYFSKPALRDNLFIQRGYYELPDPGALLLDYMAEGREIHLFYTNNDELSNQSYIEFDQDSRNLTKYRIAGVHTAVARDALKTMLGIMRRFLGEIQPQRAEDLSATVGSVEVLEDKKVRLTFNLNSEFLPDGFDIYLVKNQNSAIQKYKISIDERRRVLFTSAEEWFNIEVDNLDEEWRIEAHNRLGETVHGTVHGWDRVTAALPPGVSRATGASVLELSDSKISEYRILSRYLLRDFRYRIYRGEDSSETVTLVFVDNHEDLVKASNDLHDSDRLTAYVSVDADGRLADTFAMRIVSREGVSHLRVINRVTDPVLHQNLLRRFSVLDWKHVTVSAEWD